jgi:hypothetical protein
MGAGRSPVDQSEIRLRVPLALGVFALGFALSSARIGHGAPDFYVFWTAANHWRAPYDPAPILRLEAALHLTGVWPFAYPPTFLVLLRPLALVPLKLAYPLWSGITAALFTLAASFMVRPAWAAVALVAAPPVFIAGELGQTSLLVGAAVIAGLLARERWPALAGALFAVALCVKPQTMIMAPIVLWGRWRVLAWMAVACLALAAASLAFGAERWLEWFHALARFRVIAPEADRINPSALLPGTAWPVALAALGGWFAWTSRDLAGLTIGALLATPYAHAYDLAPLAPLALVWLIDRARSGWGLAIAGGALLAGLVATPLTALALGVAVIVLRGSRGFASSPVAASRAPAGAAGAQ